MDNEILIPFVREKKTIKKIPKRGEIWLIKCDKIKEFSKDYRPGLVISNDIQNEFDNFAVVAMMTTDDLKNIEPFEVYIENTPETGLNEPNKIILNHPFTVFKELSLKKKLGVVSREIMEQVKVAWKVAFEAESW
ncbi:MAG: PemK family transcriptional regulator [Mycoplasmataceae bacterium RC_NB112A]|nr:MAG: PemK family transcriptional regulator [Mycoplasmataceae bacterium RC_NB112A]